MGERDRVRVSGWDVERKVLEQQARELQLYPSQKNRLKYLRQRLQFIYGESAPPASGMPRAPESVGNPVLAKVERIEEIEQECREIETWLETVETVCNALTEQQQAIVNHLYLLPRSEREYTMVGLAKRLSMSESEAYRTKDEALLEFVLVLNGRKSLDECGGNVGEIREALAANR